MLSSTSASGRHEIEAAKQRLTTAKEQASSAVKTLESARAAEEWARKTREGAESQLRQSEREVEAARRFLAESEGRWGVIEIEADAEDNIKSISREGRNKRRKVSLSPGSSGNNNNLPTGIVHIDAGAGKDGSGAPDNITSANAFSGEGGNGTPNNVSAAVAAIGQHENGIPESARSAIAGINKLKSTLDELHEKSDLRSTGHILHILQTELRGRNDIDYCILFHTQIGKTVQKLCQHYNIAVKAVAQEIVTKWKRVNELTPREVKDSVKSVVSGSGNQSQTGIFHTVGAQGVEADTSRNASRHENGSPGDPISSIATIIKLRTTLDRLRHKSDGGSINQILSILQNNLQVRNDVDYCVLYHTQIGKMVQRLYRHKDKVVSRVARAIVNDWKRINASTPQELKLAVKRAAAMGMVYLGAK